MEWLFRHSLSVIFHHRDVLASSETESEVSRLDVMSATRRRMTYFVIVINLVFSLQCVGVAAFSSHQDVLCSSLPSASTSSRILECKTNEDLRRRPLGRLKLSHDEDPWSVNDEGAENELQKAKNEARVRVWTSRRRQIRATIKAAESLRFFRLANGYVFQEGDTPSDAKAALTVTAFLVAAGAVALRVGGRAALVSGLGLNFVLENPEMKEQMDAFLSYADSLGPLWEPALFIAAWTAVKVLCFDAGGVVLALASGILFGGVLQGALFSAFAATVGSAVAFGLAKLDTPVRKKALEILEEYPSLRGIEKVVAKDGVKAVLTLRLAPILPVPIGAYNYVYGVTNVPFFDFAAGIFIGSIKPYLLDSYLGYFGKSVVDGTVEGGTEDFILLAALGLSVLIGVFASQLAGETWEAVQKEIEEERKLKQNEDGETNEDDDGVVRKVFGLPLPDAVVGMQLSLRSAEEKLDAVVDSECMAKVWNFTKEEGTPPREKDPAFFPDSPEKADKGFDFVQSISESFMLTPVLAKLFLRYADPVFSEEDVVPSRSVSGGEQIDATPGYSSCESSRGLDVFSDLAGENKWKGVGTMTTDDDILEVIRALRSVTQKRIADIDDRLSK